MILIAEFPPSNWLKRLPACAVVFLMCNRRACHTAFCGRRKRTDLVHVARADAASQDSKLKLRNPA